MTTKLAVTVRNTTGKGAARKERIAGNIPGVLYADGKEATPISFEPKALLNIFRESGNRNTIVELDFDGTVRKALVQDVQRHPVGRQVLHVDFLEVGGDKMVEVMVPLAGVGRPKGAELGGRLRLIRRDLKARCKWDAIPETFEVDITPMDIGDFCMASQVPAPEGVEIVIDRDFNVLTVYGKRGGR